MKLRHWIVICWMVSEAQLENVRNGYQSFTKLSDIGLEFSPAEFQGMFLLQTRAQSLMSCVNMCHLTVECRIFDYDDQTKRCRLFEGSVGAMSSIISSSSSLSRVGSIELRPEHFVNRGHACSYCQ